MEKYKKKSIKFNKYRRWVYISKGGKSYGIYNNNDIREFIFSTEVCKYIRQSDDDYKRKRRLKMQKENNIITFELGLERIGNIDLFGFREYFDNDVLDIKEFEQL